MANISFRAPRFAPKAGQPFYQELTKRVNAYFAQNNLSPKGNVRLYVKTGVLIGGFLAAYLGLIIAAPAFKIAWMLWLALGLLTAAIGFNIMHDGAHGSFSKHNWLNEMAGHTVNFLGASILMWKTKHNTVHHTFTNIEGVDDDIDAGNLLRMAPSQEHLPIHRFQHLYFSALYALLYIYWVVFTDYKKYFTGMVGNVPIPKLTAFQHVSFWGWKALHLGLFVGLPMWKLGFLAWWLSIDGHGRRTCALSGLPISSRSDGGVLFPIHPWRANGNRRRVGDSPDQNHRQFCHEIDIFNVVPWGAKLPSGAPSVSPNFPHSLSQFGQNCEGNLRGI